MNYRNKDRTQNKYGIEYKLPAGAEYGQPVKSRPEERWRPKVNPFPPRLQRDLKKISLPPNAPEPDFWAGESLFLYGDSAVGKTVLAANMLLDVQKHLWLNFQHKKCKFVSVPELFGKLKASYDTDTKETEWDILEQHKNTWLLVLDDLGVSGKPSEWLLEKLYLLINSRYEYLMPTIFTSNIDLNDLADLLGDDRIPSRIRRMGLIAEKTHWDK